MRNAARLGVCPQRIHIWRRHFAGDHQLMRIAQRHGQLRVAGDEPEQVFPGISPARVQHERPRNTKALLKRGDVGIRNFDARENRITGAGDVRNSIFVQPQEVDRFTPRAVRNREPGIGALQLLELLSIEFFIRRIGRQVDIGLHERDQVINHRNDFMACRQLSDARDRIVAKPVEKARDQNEIRFLRIQERFADQFCHLDPGAVFLGHSDDWAGRIPDTNVFLGQQAVERRADRLDGFRKHAVEGNQKFVTRAIANQRLGERQAVAANAAKTAFALRALQIDQDAHY